MEQLTPESFKQKILAKHPNGVASDGTPYAQMDATELTRRIVQKFPDGVTGDGHKYSEYLPKQPVTPEVPVETPHGEKGLGGQLVDRAKDFYNAYSDTYHNKINPLSAGIQGVGAVAGAVNDVAGSALGLIPGVKQVEGLIGQGVQKLAGTETGQKVVGGLQNFQQAHPELSKDLSSVGDIAGAVGLATGAGELKNAAGKVFAKGLERRALKEAVEIGGPRLTPKLAAESATTKSKITGLISRVPTKTENEVGGVIKGIVKGKSFAEDKELVRNALSTEAETLQKGVDAVKQPVSPNGVKTWLENIKKPIEIEADATQSRKFELAKEALTKIVNKNIEDNPFVGSLLKSRKEFDNLVEKEFPTLYDRENHAMRSAVTAMRNALNDATEANLPDGFGFKESLKKQRLMYDAMDNLGEKMAKGSPKVVGEIGTNRLDRFTDRHPKTAGLIKKGGKYAAQSAITGAAGATGYGIYRHFTDN